MLRGEIRVVNLEPVVGSEADKRRPAVIVSNDDANATAAMLGRGVVTIVPITSSTERVLPFVREQSVTVTAHRFGTPLDLAAGLL